MNPFSLARSKPPSASISIRTGAFQNSFILSPPLLMAEPNAIQKRSLFARSLYVHSTPILHSLYVVHCDHTSTRKRNAHKPPGVYPDTQLRQLPYALRPRRGIAPGYRDNTFRPESHTTRAHISKVADGAVTGP